ncbi:MAG: fructosamine kinase family protein, partial [Thiohalomonadales bacterium]
MQIPWSTIDKKIAQSIAEPVDIETRQPVSGGCINHAYALRGPRAGFFVKINSSQRVDMFAAEFAGLNELRKSKTLRVPKPYSFAVVDGNAFLAMELLNLSAGDSSSM